MLFRSSPQLKQKRNASVSSTGGFTASGAGNSGREKKTGKRRKIFSEPDRTSLSSQEHAFWDYGYTAPAPALRSESPMQRGENRGDSAPVLSCASLRSQNGKIEVRCEDSKKELRILRAANLAKPVKRSGQILLKPQKAPRPLVPKNTKMKKAGESSGKRKQTGKGLEKNPTWRAEQSR